MQHKETCVIFRPWITSDDDDEDKENVGDNYELDYIMPREEEQQQRDILSLSSFISWAEFNLWNQKRASAQLRIPIQCAWAQKYMVSPVLYFIHLYTFLAKVNEKECTRKKIENRKLNTWNTYTHKTSRKKQRQRNEVNM